MALSPIVSKVWMWRIVGIAIAITTICMVMHYTTKKLHSGTRQKRMVVGRPKQEPIVLTSTFKLKPGEYVGPIVAPSETEPWQIKIDSWKAIHVKLMDRHGRLVWESDMGPNLSRVQIPRFFSGSSFLITSLDEEHEIQVSWRV